MSWLSDSFSNLRGQISTLTDVLSEGREEVKDYEAELDASTKRVRDLEAYSSSLRSEIEKLRIANAELEERCQSSELQVGSLTSQCRSLIRNQPQQVLPEPNSGDDGEDSAPRHLIARIQELETQLQTISDQHQLELATLQDHYTHQLAALRSSQVPQADEPEDRSISLAELQRQKEELESRVARMEADKQVLEQSLVELDQQNQEAIAEVLQVKQNLQAENQTLKTQLEALRGQDSVDTYARDLESQLKQSQLDVERLTCEASGARSEVQSLQLQVEEQSQELDVLREEKLNSEETLNNLENTHLLQLQSCRDEVNEVRLTQARAESTLRNKIEGLTQEAALLEGERDELDAQLQEARAKVESLQAQLRQPANTDMSTLADDLASHKSYQELQAEVESLQSQLRQPANTDMSTQADDPANHKSCQELQAEIEALQAQLLQPDSVDMSTQADDLAGRKSYQELQAEVESLQAQLLQPDSVDMSTQADDLAGRKSYQELQAEVESLQAQLRQPTSVDMSTQADDPASHKSYQELQAEVAMLTSKLESRPALEETIKEAIVQNVCVEIASCNRLEKVIQTDLTESDVPQKPYEDLEAEIQLLKAKIQNQEAENQTLAANLQHVIALIPPDHLPPNRSNSSMRDLLSEIDLGKEVESHVAKDSHQESYILKLEVSLRIKEDESSRLLREIESKNNKLKIAQENVAELHSQMEALEAKSRSENNLASKSKELEAKISHMELEKEQMLSVLSEKSRECSNLKAEVHRLVDVVVAEKKALEKLQTDNQNLSRSPPENIEDKQTIENLTQVIQEKDREIRELQKMAAAVQDTSEQSTSSAESLQDLSRENAELRGRISQSEQELARLEEKYRRAEALHLSESKKYDQLQGEFQVLRQQYENKQKSLLDSSKETILMKQKITEREQLYEELLNQHKESQRSGQDIAARLQRENQELRQCIGQQEHLLAELRDKHAKLQEELSEVRAQLQVKENEVTGFNQGLLRMFPPDGATAVETSRSPMENLQEMVKERDALQTEAAIVKDREGKLLKELERLKEHLLIIEESYTQEALRAEEREVELRNQVAQLEEARAEHVAEQRDEALAQVSALEDRLQRSAADLSNLQLVLDHFHRDRVREVDRLRDQHAVELASARAEADSIRAELGATQQRLSQAASALDAAQRLSAQLDSKEALLSDLQKEVEKKDRLLEKCLQESYSNTEGKVDRQILKNLVLNYLVAPDSHKSDVVRILAKVLDFNDTEMEKAGIKVGKDLSWWSKPSTSDTNNPPSLSSAFIKFLEAESQPQRPPLKLPVDRKEQTAFKLK